MPAEAKSSTATAPLSDANALTPKKKQSAGKAALARVTLLDGSILDVTIDVSFELYKIYYSIGLILIFLLPCSEKPKEKIC